jgi:hypothetical protein
VRFDVVSFSAVWDIFDQNCDVEGLRTKMWFALH